MIDFKLLEKQNKALGKHPKCPDCGNELSHSVIVPYYMVCAKCETIMSPTLKDRVKLKEALQSNLKVSKE